MFTLTHLTVQGFRGFRDTEEFVFDRPATLFCGDNHSGKSSGLNALEWCLFGKECTGKETGIRERIGWDIPNRHLPAPEVRVELELAGPDGALVIRRSLHRRGKKTALEAGLELTLPDGAALTGDEAEQRLAGLLQASFKDFLTTVYQHQESIRAVLTQEPRDRNDAIDRLLGLSDQRNLLGALDAAGLRSRHKEIRSRFDGFEEEIRTALAARERDLDEVRHTAQEAGVAGNQLTARAALAGARAVEQALHAFTEEIDIAPPALSVPEAWTGLGEFVNAVKKAIGRLRGEVPGIKEQQDYLGQREKVLKLQSGLADNKEKWAELATQVRELEKEHGSKKAVEAQVRTLTGELTAKREQLRQTSARAAVVHEAIQFLEAEETAADDHCPVCGNEAPDLLATLQRLWTDNLQASVAKITARIQEIQGQLKTLRAVADQYQKLEEAGERLKDERAKLERQVGTLLGRELAAEDDPLALLSVELKRLDLQLRKLGEAIKARQERLDIIEQDLERVRIVRDFLHLESKKQVLEKIQECDEFKALEALRDRIAELVEDAEAIKDAIAAVSREEAQARLAAAGTTIDKYFRQLSQNPAVSRLQLKIDTDKRTHRNGYDIVDQDGKDLTPILSQGDLNGLALAIFLGLATAAEEAGTFGFLMLDDPSQSLGSQHKQQLARVLNDVAQHRKIVVATMDAEFRACLVEGLTRAKTEYRFCTWTPEAGPTIERK